jgi:hypothetical protein
MVRKEVTLCDNCKDKVSKEKCEICGKDICERCLNALTFESGTSGSSGISWFEIPICNECVEQHKQIKMENGDRESFRRVFIDVPEELRKIMVDFIKNTIMLNQLKGEKPKPPQPTTGAITITTPITTSITGIRGNSYPPPINEERYRKYWTQKQEKQKSRIYKSDNDSYVK